MTLVLADDAEVRRLNRIWRGINTTTDVFSFPADRSSPARAACRAISVTS